jgi:hypothetical protein
MSGKRIVALAALALLSLPWATAHAGVFIGVGVPYYRPYCYRPYWYGPRIIIAPPPIAIAPAPVVVAPAPVVVQPAPAVLQTQATLPSAPTPVGAPLPGPAPSLYGH